MRAPIPLLLATAAALALAGCVDDPPDENAGNDTTLDQPDTSAMCLEGAEECDDTPTTETVEDPYYVGT